MWNIFKTKVFPQMGLYAMGTCDFVASDFDCNILPNGHC